MHRDRILILKQEFSNAKRKVVTYIEEVFNDYEEAINEQLVQEQKEFT